MHLFCHWQAYRPVLKPPGLQDRTILANSHARLKKPVREVLYRHKPCALARADGACLPVISSGYFQFSKHKAFYFDLLWYNDLSLSEKSVDREEAEAIE